VNGRAAEFADRIEGAGESSAEGTGRGSRSDGGDRDPTREGASATPLGGPSVAPGSPSCRPVDPDQHPAPAGLEVREIVDWEREATRADVDRWMELPAGGAVATTFPLLHAPRARSRAWGAFTADGRLAAHVAACRMEVRTDDRAEPVSMSFVGTVACDPVHRGRGLATAVLARALADEAHAGCSWSVLWTDRPELYARLGFAPVGAEFDLQLDRPSLAAAGIAARRSGTTRPARLDDLPALVTLHARKPRGVVRTAQDWVVALDCRPLDCRVRVDAAGHVVAYAIRGKGCDFEGWWHEVGGRDAEVFALLSAVAATEDPDAGTFAVALPSYRDELIESLRRVALDGEVRPAALARALMAPSSAPQSASEALAPALPDDFYVDGLDSV
jgi:GNAT superfamily N-acetyltransferase